MKEVGEEQLSLLSAVYLILGSSHCLTQHQVHVLSGKPSHDRGGGGKGERAEFHYPIAVTRPVAAAVAAGQWAVVGSGQWTVGRGQRGSLGLHGAARNNTRNCGAAPR